MFEKEQKKVRKGREEGIRVESLSIKPEKGEGESRGERNHRKGVR